MSGSTKHEETKKQPSQAGPVSHTSASGQAEIHEHDVSEPGVDKPEMGEHIGITDPARGTAERFVPKGEPTQRPEAFGKVDPAASPEPRAGQPPAFTPQNPSSGWPGVVPRPTDELQGPTRKLGDNVLAATTRVNATPEADLIAQEFEHFRNRVMDRIGEEHRKGVGSDFDAFRDAVEKIVGKSSR